MRWRCWLMRCPRRKRPVPGASSRPRSPVATRLRHSATCEKCSPAQCWMAKDPEPTRVIRHQRTRASGEFWHGATPSRALSRCGSNSAARCRTCSSRERRAAARPRRSWHSWPAWPPLTRPSGFGLPSLISRGVVASPAWRRCRTTKESSPTSTVMTCCEHSPGFERKWLDARPCCVTPGTPTYRLSPRGFEYRAC